MDRLRKSDIAEKDRGERKNLNKMKSDRKLQKS